MDPETTFAQRFADDWIDSWNAHDLDRVLSQYDDGFERSSSLIAQFAGKSSAVLRGKSAIARIGKRLSSRCRS